MKFGFTDSYGKRYVFELDAESDITEPHVEITVNYPSPSTGSSITVRPIVDEKVLWYGADDGRVSVEARNYLDKVIKNKAFL
jgi:hypothetical protein